MFSNVILGSPVFWIFLFGEVKLGMEKLKNHTSWEIHSICLHDADKVDVHTEQKSCQIQNARRIRVLNGYKRGH
jgi:hypothetical protein